MPKLNQIIAVSNGKKTQTQKTLTDIYQKLGKTELFSGLSRVYRPDDDAGETLPAENKVVQIRVSDAIQEASATLTELFDTVLTQDVANTQAKADVVVDGTTLLKNVPVTYLLFLEKQLTDIRTFISHLPVLDPSETWNYDPNTDCYRTNPTISNRNKKVYRNHVKAEASDKHPAQVEVYTEDVKVGEWNVTRFAGAIPAKQKHEFLAKLAKLDEAVKFARETANAMDVQKQEVGSVILDYIFK